jgi:hypothetical protein
MKITLGMCCFLVILLVSNPLWANQNNKSPENPTTANQITKHKEEKKLQTESSAHNPSGKKKKMIIPGKDLS